MMEVTPIPKPKRIPKSKRTPNPLKEKYSRVIDPQAVEDARRTYCVACGLSRDDSKYFDVHHIIRRSQKGSDKEDNLINLCRGPGSNFCHERAGGIMVDKKPAIKPEELQFLLDEDLRYQRYRNRNS